MIFSVGDVIRASFRFRYAGVSDIVNTFDYEVATVGTGGSDGWAEDLQEVGDTSYSVLADFLPSTLVPMDISFLYRPSIAYLPPVDFTVGTPPAAVADPMPPGTAALVLWHTGVRRCQKRSYVGPTTEAMNTAGQPNPTAIGYLENWAAGMEDFNGMSNGWECNLVVWRDAVNLVARTTTWAIQPEWTNLSRRRPGRGS